MNQKLINWELVFPLIEQLAVLRVYIVIVANMDLKQQWYSNRESRAKVEWRWQMAPSTVKYGISQLVKKGFLRSESRGIYTVDKRFLLNDTEE